MLGLLIVTEDNANRETRNAVIREFLVANWPPCCKRRIQADAPASQESGFSEGFAAGVAEERARLLAIGEATLREALQSLEVLYMAEFRRFDSLARSNGPAEAAMAVWGF